MRSKYLVPRFGIGFEEEKSDELVSHDLPGYDENMVKTDLQRMMSKLSRFKILKSYEGMPAKDIQEAVQGLIEMLIQYYNTGSIDYYAPWLNGRRSNELEAIQKAVFGPIVEEWLKKKQNLKGRPALVEAAANRMAKDPELGQSGVEIAIEMIRFAAANMFGLGTTDFNTFISSFRKQGFSNLPDIVISVNDYMELISLLGTTYIQEYLNSVGFEQLPRSERLNGLIGKLKDRGLSFNRINWRKDIFYALPYQLTAKVKRADLLTFREHRIKFKEGEEGVDRVY